MNPNVRRLLGRSVVCCLIGLSVCHNFLKGQGKSTNYDIIITTSIHHDLLPPQLNDDCCGSNKPIKATNLFVSMTNKPTNLNSR